MNKYKLLLFLAVILSGSYSSSAQDTASMIKDFNKVMSFSVEPYMHYRSFTSMSATPVMQQEDTLTIRGEFFKNGNELYYGNAQEEMFIQDSFYIQVNHLRKTVWISKVDVNTKDKMNRLPLNSKEMQSLFRKKFTISETAIDNEVRRLNFESKQFFDSVANVVVNIGLQYSGKNYIPKVMEMNVRMKQAVSTEQLLELGAAGSAIEKSAGQNYFIRNQKVTILFEDVDNSKEKAMQIPSWKEKVSYDEHDGIFTGKGSYSNYEITKTF